MRSVPCLMPEDSRLQLKMESALSSVEAAELITQRLAQIRGVDDDEIGLLGMAVREIMVNAVSHGNGYSRGKSVYFSIKTSAKRITITIRDEGEGFDPDEVPDPRDQENLLKVSGRGLLLVRSFVDEVDIRRLSPRGTEVIMVKKFGEQSSPREDEVSLSTSIREVDGVTIVDLSGRITLGEASGKLRDTVRETLAGGQKSILLNLGDVSYIDSSGLGELVSSYTTASNQGAKVKLVNLQQKVNDLLQITKLLTVFDIFENEADAVISFSS